MPIIKGHEGMKYCPKCDPLHERPPKPLSDFPRNCNRGDGHGAYCKLCSKLINHNSYRKTRVEWNEKRRVRRVEKTVQASRPAANGKCNCHQYSTCLICRNTEKRRAWKANEIPAYRLRILQTAAGATD
jgi:hypothetical protein